MTDPANRVAETDEMLTVRVRRVLPAPRERVYEAWTSPEMIVRWWGPEGYRATSAEADARPGGAFAVEIEGPDGTLHLMAGLFLELVPSALVRFEFHHRQMAGAADQPEGYIPTQVRVELNEHADGTELLLTHTGFLDAAVAAQFNGGWASTLDKLETVFVSKEN